MDTKAKKLTNEVGAPVAENEHSLTGGSERPGHDAGCLAPGEISTF